MLFSYPFQALGFYYCDDTQTNLVICDLEPAPMDCSNRSTAQTQIGRQICGTPIGLPAISHPRVLRSVTNNPSLYFLHGTHLETKKYGGGMWRLLMLKILVRVEKNLQWTFWGNYHGVWGGPEERLYFPGLFTHLVLVFNNANTPTAWLPCACARPPPISQCLDLGYDLMCASHVCWDWVRFRNMPVIFYTKSQVTQPF